MESFQDGIVIWRSPRRDLFAVQAGACTEFLTRSQLTYNPCTPASQIEFDVLPSADPQNRPDRERYLRVLSSAYPDYDVVCLTVLEGVRTSCYTGQRWRVFCQTALLRHQQKGLLLDVEGDHVWYGGVAVADLSVFVGKSWSPHVAVPHQWDALDIPEQQMAKMVSEGLAALADLKVIAYPPAICIETGDAGNRVIRRAVSRQASSPASQVVFSSLE
jgi:hypothetical protein